VLWVTGPGKRNPPVAYLSSGAQISHTDILKRVGQKPVLFHSAIERENIRSDDLMLKCYSDYPLGPLIKAAGGDADLAMVMRYEQILRDLGITSGTVAISGLMEAGKAYALFSQIKNRIPGLDFAGDMDQNIFLAARSTKEPFEIECLRDTACITAEVVGRVRDFLSMQTLKGGILVDKNTNPVCIKDIKRRLRLWLAELGAEDDGDTIFSTGRAAGIPHHPGNPEEPLRAGETIIFDIFPRSMTHGYYSDMTRTWCLGFARDEVFKVYNDVLNVQLSILNQMEAGKSYFSYHQFACAEFEQRGYPTMRSDPTSEEGYVHALGHGVGLDVHEQPACGISEETSPRLEAGMVLTIEPGLYFPESGFGIRIEDTVLVKPDGKLEILGEVPKDLVIRCKTIK